MKKTLFIAALFQAALPSAGSCAWEKVRESAASATSVSASTGAYEISCAVGEALASSAELAASPSGVWSGYLSLVPAEVVNPGLSGFASTAAASAEGALVGVTPGEQLDLVFASEIAPSLSAPGVTVTRLTDNSGSVLSSTFTWPVTVAYSGNKLVLAPSGSWPKGSAFAVYFSSSLSDVTGSPLSPAATLYFSVIMDHQADNTALSLLDSRVRVSIPAGAYAQDYYVLLSTDASLPAVQAANGRLRGLPGAPEFVGTVRVRPYDQSGTLVQPSSACVVTLPYPDADGDGWLDGTLTRQSVSGLAVWHLDEATGLWQRQSGATLDAAARTVSQRVTGFSNYALLAVTEADLSPVYASPVPFRPNAGNPARYGTWAGGITFRNLPAYGRLRIYTISGALVRELAVSPPTTAWDVKNSDGEVVASGVYLWELTADKARKTGKLVVIK